jgi:hypothetical protein
MKTVEPNKGVSPEEKDRRRRRTERAEKAKHRKRKDRHANPLGTLEALPKGKRMWEAVYDSALDRGFSESRAAQQAWGAVKAAGYEQDEGGTWRAPNGAGPVSNPPESDERMTMRRFDAAADKAERSLRDAVQILGKLPDVGNEKDRRRVMADAIEALLDAAYALGLAEGHLLHLGRKDPFKVPRYRQVADMFAEAWKGAEARTGNPGKELGREFAKAAHRGRISSGGDRKGNRAIKLPKRGEDPVVLEARGERLLVRPSDRRNEWIVAHGPRVMIGDRDEVLEEVEYFETFGMLQPSSPGLWQNPRSRKVGWVGPVDAVQDYLVSVGADKDADGRFLVGGDPPIYDRDGVVISEQVVYYAQRRPVPLARALSETY